MKPIHFILLVLCVIIFFFLGMKCTKPDEGNNKPKQTSVENFFTEYDTLFDKDNKNSFGGLTLEYATMKQLVDESRIIDTTSKKGAVITTPKDFRIALIVDKETSSKMLLVEPRYDGSIQEKVMKYKFILAENKFERAEISDITFGKWYAFNKVESSHLKSFNELFFTNIIAQTTTSRDIKRCPPNINCMREVSPTNVTIPSETTKPDTLILVK